MSHSTDQYRPIISPRPRHTHPNLIQEPNPRIFSLRPRLTYHVPFPATPCTLPSPPSLQFQATFAWQIEAAKPQLFPDLNEIAMPARSLSTAPSYLSPTIKEIESLTLDSGPRHDMGDHIMNDVYACSLWDHVQQNLYMAWQLEAMAREHRQQATIEWERFRTQKFNRRIMGVHYVTLFFGLRLDILTNLAGHEER